MTRRRPAAHGCSPSLPGAGGVPPARRPTANVHRRRDGRTRRSISIRASARTTRRRRSISCSTTRWSGSTNSSVVPDLAESLEQPDPVDVRRAPAPGRAVPQRPRAHVGGRGLHVPELSRSCLPRPVGRVPSAGQRSTRVDRYTVAFKLKAPLGSFPDQPGDGDRAGRVGRGERARADRHRPLPAGRVRSGRSRRRSTAFDRLLRRARRATRRSC